MVSVFAKKVKNNTKTVISEFAAKFVINLQMLKISAKLYEINTSDFKSVLIEKVKKKSNTRKKFGILQNVLFEDKKNKMGAINVKNLKKIVEIK